MFLFNDSCNTLKVLLAETVSFKILDWDYLKVVGAICYKKIQSSWRTNRSAHQFCQPGISWNIFCRLSRIITALKGPDWLYSLLTAPAYTALQIFLIWLRAQNLKRHKRDRHRWIWRRTQYCVQILNFRHDFRVAQWIICLFVFHK